MACHLLAAKTKSGQFLKRFALITLVAICGVFLNGCNSSNSKGGSAGGEIVLGHYASMTGSEATFGRSTDNGIQLAIDEINDAGGINGKKVSVITYDDKG